MISQAVQAGLSSEAMQDILEYAKNASVKEIQAKFSSVKESYKQDFSVE